MEDTLASRAALVPSSPRKSTEQGEEEGEEEGEEDEEGARGPKAPNF